MENKMTRILSTEDQKALAIARNVVSLWNGYSDDNSEESDLAMRDAFKAVEALDLHRVEGILASPLNYFARAFLNDENPEDLTFGEMSQSLEISIGLIDEETK
jgi:hypothetical protein